MKTFQKDLVAADSAETDLLRETDDTKLRAAKMNQIQTLRPN